MRHALLLHLILLHTTTSQRASSNAYNTAWLSPTVESNPDAFVGGLPLGNGDTAVLAWANVSAAGISLYVSKQNALHSDASNYKVALLTISLSPDPFFLGGDFFNQSLDISTGTFFLHAGGTASAPAASFSVWVDAASNSVFIDAGSVAPSTVTATLTPIRPAGYAPYAAPWKCTKTSSTPDVAVADPLPPFPSPATLVLLHENTAADRPVPLVASTLTTQGLASAIPTVPDIFENRRSGVAVDAVGCAAFRRTSPLTLTSASLTTCATLRVTVRSSQAEADRDAWVAALAAQVASAPTAPPRSAHVAWWRAFWTSTWVDIDAPDGAGFNVSQTYAMSRYMNAVQSRVVDAGGAADQQPIKFNGLAWTSKRPGSAGSKGGAGCADGLGPDCREWGPDAWHQNTRLAYWPMLADGDFDQLDVFITYYLRTMPFLRARAQALLPGASAFPDMLWQTETATVFGAFTEVDWVGSGTDACTRPRPADLPPYLQANSYIYLDAFGDGPTGELGLIILDAFAYTGDAAALATRLPWIFGALDYFTYRFVDAGTGAVRIAPTQACETLWSPWPITASSERVEGDAPTIAVVTRLLERTLLEVPAALLPAARRAAFAAVLAAMPALPLAGANKTLLAPAILATGPTHNSESVALYAVHPARHFSIGRLLTGGVPSIAAAIATFYTDPNAGGSAEGNNGWHQGTMHAPLLGLRAETAALLVNRTRGTPLPGYRFPFFSAEDGMGDEAACEAFSNLAAGVQHALLQAGEHGEIVVLPGWPCAWDVHFKLRAPANTTVEGVFKGGKLLSLSVVPASRAADVIVAPGC
jgi:hypothetical protein